jgi:hypothetical protein
LELCDSHHPLSPEQYLEDNKHNIKHIEKLKIT